MTDGLEPSRGSGPSSGVECSKCKAFREDYDISRCPICLKFVCNSCSLNISGRNFCSQGCANYFFHGDEDESEELPELPWEARILIVRSGALRLPLTVELRFDDGTSRRQVWSREDQRESRWLMIDHRGAEKLVSVALDPDRVYFLDGDMSNNRWYEETDSIAPLRWTERAFNRYLHLLHWQAGIGG